jgi:hypothetical protein
LVAQAPSQIMNPNVDLDWIKDQFDEDPIGAEAEFNAQFAAMFQVSLIGKSSTPA